MYKDEINSISVDFVNRSISYTKALGDFSESGSIKFSGKNATMSAISTFKQSYKGKMVNVMIGYDLNIDKRKTAIGGAVAAVVIVSAVVAWPYVAAAGIGGKLAAAFTLLLF